MFWHDNILKCYDIYENDDFTILVTEMCEDGTLWKEMQKKKTYYE